MSDVTKDMLIRLVGDTSSIDRAFTQTQQKGTTLRNELTTAFKGVGVALGAATAAAGTLAVAVSKVGDAAGEGRKLKGLEDSFRTLQQQAGLLASDSLAKLRAATLGTVDDFALMEKANKAVQLGLDPASLDTMAAAATKLGLAVGRDAGEAFDDLAIGVGRQSRLILDNLGIIVKADEEYGDLAKQLGVATKELTFQEKAMEEIRRTAERLGDSTLNAGDAAQQFGASYQTARKQLTAGVAESDQLAEAFKKLSIAVAEVDWRQLGKDIGDFAAIVVDAATKVAEFAAGFQALVSPFDTVRGQVLEQNKALLANVKTLEELAPVQKMFEERLRAAETEFARLDEKTRNWVEGTGKIPVALAAAGGQYRAYEELLELAAIAQDNLAKGLPALADGLSGTGSRAGTSRPVSEAAQKAAEKLADLRKEFAGLELDLSQNKLKKQIEVSLDSLNAADFSKYSEAFLAATEKGLREAFAKFGGAVDDPRIEAAIKDSLSFVSEDLQEQWVDATEAAAEIMRDEFQATADFFQDALYNAMTGAAFDFEDMGKRLLAGLAAGFAAQLLEGTALSGLLGSGLNLQGLGINIGAQLAGGAVSGAGGSFLNSALGSAGAYGLGQSATLSGYGAALGYNFGAFAGTSGIGPVASGTAYGSALAGESALAGLGAVAWPLALAGAGLFIAHDQGMFDSNKSPGQRRRDDIRNTLQSTGLGENLIFRGVRGDINIGDSPFTIDPRILDSLGLEGSGRYSRNLQGILGTANRTASLTGGTMGDLGVFRALDTTRSLASIVTGGAMGDQGTEELATMFANAVSEAANFNEQLVNTNTLLGQLGVSGQQIKDDLTAAFLDGEIALDEFTRGVSEANILIADDLVGENSVLDAINILADNLGPDGGPRQALAGLRHTFSELAERGIDSTDEIRAFFTERFGPDVANTFATMAEAGIDFSNLTADNIAYIFPLLEQIVDLLQNGLGDAYNEAGNTSEKFFKSTRNDIENTIRDYERLAEAARNATAEAPTPSGGGSSGPTLANNPWRTLGARTGQSRTVVSRNLGVNS